MLVPPVAFLALLLFLPVAYLAVEALRNNGFEDALANEVFRAAIPRTFLLAASVTAIALVLGTVYALGIAVAPRWVAGVLLVALFAMFWTSLVVRTYGWILLYFPQGPIYDALHGVGLRDQPLAIYQTPLAAYPAMVHVMLPFIVLPVYASARQIDPEHLRAARVMGARWWLILRKVVLPQLRGGMLAGAVLVFVVSLGFYVTPQMLGDPTKPTVVGVIGARFGVPGEGSIAAAMSVLLLLVIGTFYVIADRILRVSEHWGRS